MLLLVVKWLGESVVAVVVVMPLSAVRVDVDCVVAVVVVVVVDVVCFGVSADVVLCACDAKVAVRKCCAGA